MTQPPNTPSTPSPIDVLACPMNPDKNDASAETVGEYLAKLLGKVWDEQDDFDGKRPFGNSSWSSELELALAQAGMVDGEIDPEGPWLFQVDQNQADRLIHSAIATLAAKPGIVTLAQNEAESTWTVRVTGPTGYGAVEMTHTASYPDVNEDRILTLRSATDDVVAIYARDQWLSVARAPEVTVEVPQ